MALIEKAKPAALLYANKMELNKYSFGIFLCLNASIIIFLMGGH
jgi:hypothetical protein